MADNTYTNISDLPTLDSVGENTWVPVEVAGKQGKKVDLSTIGEQKQVDWNQTDNTQADFIKNKPTIPKVGYLNTTLSATQATNSAETLSGTVKLHKVSKTGKYADLLELPKLRTNITGSLDPVYEETITGTIKLHKIAKTGNYSDLIDKPSIPSNTNELNYNYDKFVIVKGNYGSVIDADNFDGSAGPKYYNDSGATGAIYTCWGDETRPLYAFSFYEKDVSSVTDKHYDWESDWSVTLWHPHTPGLHDGYYEKLADFDDLDEILCIVRHPNPDGPKELFGINLMTIMKIIPAMDHTGEITLRLAYVAEDFNYSAEGIYNYSDLLPYLTNLTCISTRKKINVALPGYVRITGDVFEIMQ